MNAMRRDIVVKAKSKKTVVSENPDGSIVVQVRAPPEDGKANLEVEKALKRHFRKPVRIVAGFRSRHKTVEFP